jgi:hypothetical protein
MINDVVEFVEEEGDGPEGSVAVFGREEGRVSAS